MTHSTDSDEQRSTPEASSAPEAGTEMVGLLDWTWLSGGNARVVSSDGDRILVQSSVAAPPGQPLSAKTANGRDYHVKVRSCRRIGPEPLVFQIDGRLFNLQRDARERLLAALAAL